MCICSLNYPACNTHAPYCHVWPVLLYCVFPHYLTNGTILEESYLTWNVFWFSLRSLFEKFLIRRRSERDVIIKVCCYSCKISVILVWFERIVNFLYRFSKNTQISNFVKICLVGVEQFHANRRTDWEADRHDETTSRFSQFYQQA